MSKVDAKTGEEMQALKINGGEDAGTIMGRGRHGLPLDPKMPRDHVRVFFRTELSGCVDRPRTCGVFFVTQWRSLFSLAW